MNQINIALLVATNYTSINKAMLANQSLKLTEPAVDDFAARCWTDLGASDWNVRATNYLAAAVRRRSLAPVR
jgi:hypothetical protein